MHVVVVGAGVVGLCAAWALVRAGHRVSVVERAEGIPHREGTSYDQHRLTRHMYGAQAGYCAMMDDADQAWSLAWGDLGASHMARCGALALCTAPGDWTDRSAAVGARLGKPWRRLTAADVAREYPILHSADVLFGLHDPAGGVLFADRIMDGLAGWLRARGAALLPGRTCDGIDPHRAAVHLDGGEALRGDALLVAAGAWSDRLVPAFAGQYVPLRQVVAYVEPPARLAAAWRQAPAMLDLGGPRGMYLAPPVAGRGMKVGVGAHNRPAGAEDEPPRGEEGPALLEYYRGRLRGWDGFRVTGLRVCRYANEPDQRYLTWRGGHAVAVAGCSGHAFKFGALTGLALAETLLGEGPPDLAAWMAGDAPGWRPAALAERVPA